MLTFAAGELPAPVAGPGAPGVLMRLVASGACEVWLMLETLDMKTSLPSETNNDEDNASVVC